LVLSAIVSVQVMAVMILEIIRKHRSDPRIHYLLVAWLFPSAAMFIVSYLMRPIYVPRAFIFSSVAYGILAAVVFSGIQGNQIRKPSMAWLLTGLWLLTAGIGVIYQATYAEFPRSPYQQAAQYLEGQVQPGDRVIQDNKLSYFPMHYYAPDLEETFIGDEPGTHNDTYAAASQAAIGLYPSANIETAAGDAGRVYFVVYQKTIDEYIEMGQTDHPVLVWLKSHYRQTARTQFNDLWVIEFER
jgi:hypothetical protein